VDASAAATNDFAAEGCKYQRSTFFQPAAGNKESKPLNATAI
jgi:hypothetical protein